MEIKFSKNLKRLRLKRGFTQWDISCELEKTHTVISHWENDRAFPQFIDLCRLADMLQCSLEELVYGAPGGELVIQWAVKFCDDTYYTHTSKKEAQKASMESEVVKLEIREIGRC